MVETQPNPGTDPSIATGNTLNNELIMNNLDMQQLAGVCNILVGATQQGPNEVSQVVSANLNAAISSIDRREREGEDVTAFKLSILTALGGAAPHTGTRDAAFDRIAAHLSQTEMQVLTQFDVNVRNLRQKFGNSPLFVAQLADHLGGVLNFDLSQHTSADKPSALYLTALSYAAGVTPDQSQQQSLLRNIAELYSK